MLLTDRQKEEKAVQHIIVFGLFAAKEYCNDASKLEEVLRGAYERVLALRCPPEKTPAV